LFLCKNPTVPHFPSYTLATGFPKSTIIIHSIFSSLPFAGFFVIRNFCHSLNSIMIDSMSGMIDHSVVVVLNILIIEVWVTCWRIWFWLINNSLYLFANRDDNRKRFEKQLKLFQKWRTYLKIYDSFEEYFILKHYDTELVIGNNSNQELVSCNSLSKMVLIIHKPFNLFINKLNKYYFSII